MRRARIAVDVCIGIAGIHHLRNLNHYVVVAAEHGEPDREWFARALAAGAEVVISPDSDLEALCHDHNIAFFRVRQGDPDLSVVTKFVRWWPKHLHKLLRKEP